MSAYVKLRSAVALALLSSAFDSFCPCLYGPVGGGQTTVAEILKKSVDGGTCGCKAICYDKRPTTSFCSLMAAGDRGGESKAKHFAGPDSG